MSSTLPHTFLTIHLLLLDTQAQPFEAVFKDWNADECKYTVSVPTGGNINELQDVVIDSGAVTTMLSEQEVEPGMVMKSCWFQGLPPETPDVTVKQYNVDCIVNGVTVTDSKLLVYGASKQSFLKCKHEGPGVTPNDENPNEKIPS